MGCFVLRWRKDPSSFFDIFFVLIPFIVSGLADGAVPSSVGFEKDNKGVARPQFTDMGRTMNPEKSVRPPPLLFLSSWLSSSSLFLLFRSSFLVWRITVPPPQPLPRVSLSFSPHLFSFRQAHDA